jgi:hypothetical protein
MARVVMQAVVSVDGYIAYPDDTVGPLFDWYGNGDTEVSARASGWTFHVSRASADYVQPFWDAIKVTVIGRHLFDTTNGWDGDPAAGFSSWTRSSSACPLSTAVDLIKRTIQACSSSGKTACLQKRAFSPGSKLLLNPV